MARVQQSRGRTEVKFRQGVLDRSKVILSIKATLWAWLNMSKGAMEQHKKIKFLDLLIGWMYVIVQQL
ncbi:hypothetical protein FRX31_016182 [Thalictrum thalictroides]|uniref:Uncharacterized protein n=1 Tax=Thalictrum thalictroides TaxID=46969 RepID=A0A7J6W9X5_THATH|nr:hypothetical protein FRX31_016182 [Thalictrum thalictroides]